MNKSRSSYWVTAGPLWLMVGLVGALSGFASSLSLKPAIAQPPLSRDQEIQIIQQANELDIKGSDALNTQRYQEAIQFYRQVETLYRQLGGKYIDEILAAQNDQARALLLLEDYQAAISLFQQVASSVKSGSFRAGVNSNLGLALYEAKQFPAAERALRNAIADWEFIRSVNLIDAEQITLFEQQAHTYRLLQKALVAQKKYDAGLELAEWSRARALEELLTRQIEGKPGLAQPPSIAQIREIAQAQKVTLVVYAIVGKEVRVLGDEPTTETDLHIWVVQPSGQLTFRRVDLTQVPELARLTRQDNLPTLARLVRNSRDSIGVGSRGLVFQENTAAIARASRSVAQANKDNPDLQLLYRLLIEPIVEFLPKNPDDRVTFSPQGPLLLVPFAALQDQNGKYLIEKHTITTTPSARVLALTQTLKSQRGRVAPSGPASALIVGNPVMPSFAPSPGQPPKPLASLPGAEEEARAIAPLLNTTPLIGPAATKAAVLQRIGQSRIIHLATHGLLDIDPNLNEFGGAVDRGVRTARQSRVFITPGSVIIGPGVTIGGVPAEAALAREKVVQVAMPGLIALAPANGDTGFLSAKEIATLQLQADLVVLSACNTGRGRVTGEGVVGLSRAFIAAGAPTVVVSLWAVPDTPTATLMTTFYQTMQEQAAQGRVDKARALRQATLTTLQQYPDPMEWAAFTLVGATN